MVMFNLLMAETTAVTIYSFSHDYADTSYTMTLSTLWYKKRTAGNFFPESRLPLAQKLTNLFDLPNRPWKPKTGITEVSFEEMEHEFPFATYILSGKIGPPFEIIRRVP